MYVSLTTLSGSSTVQYLLTFIIRISMQCNVVVITLSHKSSSGPNLGDRVRKLSVSLMDKIVLNHNTLNSGTDTLTNTNENKPGSSSNSTPMGETVRKLSFSALMDKISFSGTANSEPSE